jgi:predicted ribosome quality control (RQC) complex YloA/Tae2 family protein
VVHYDINSILVVTTAYSKYPLGNPIASLVAELRLGQNTVVVRLEDPYDDDDDDSRMGSSRVKCVAIDLSLTAYANARTIYASRKHAKVKEQKTIEVSTRVIQNVEATVLRALETQKLKRSLNAIRTTHWFEKFNWFLTSEGYLCLSGRDAQQNELLVKRYLRPMDAYVHADVSGAASCIVRSKSGGTCVRRSLMR